MDPRKTKESAISLLICKTKNILLVTQTNTYKEQTNHLQAILKFCSGGAGQRVVPSNSINIKAQNLLFTSINDAQVYGLLCFFKLRDNGAGDMRLAN